MIVKEIKGRVPDSALALLSDLISHDELVIKVKKERKTRHGDYRMMPGGFHQITVNENLNPYRFLITLVHEIAHFEAYQKYGRFIKPHGKEWKFTFKNLMLPFLNPDVFPDELLKVLAKHFKNPKASSNSDVDLIRALRAYDPPNGKNLVSELPLGSHFKLYNGKIFRKEKLRVKRIECIEIESGKLYLFNPNAEVESIII